MGFTTGFTGGVTLTLSVAYLTALAHQRNREQQAASLRAQALAISSLIDPLPAPLPPTRSEVAAAQRDSAIEVVKDRWNHEVMSAVRWAQYTDWTEVREGVEGSASRLWASAFGASPEETGKAVVKEAEPVTHKAKVVAQDRAQALSKKTERVAQDVETAAENKFLEARLRAEQAASGAADTVAKDAEQAKGIFASALERGKNIVDQAKATVGIAEDKVAAAVEGKTLTGLNPVKKALHQRYEKPEARKAKTVAEALAERYAPMDSRDNTMLRGL